MIRLDIQMEFGDLTDDGWKRTVAIISLNKDEGTKTRSLNWKDMAYCFLE